MAPTVIADTVANSTRGRVALPTMPGPTDPPGMAVVGRAVSAVGGQHGRAYRQAPGGPGNLRGIRVRRLDDTRDHWGDLTVCRLRSAVRVFCCSGPRTGAPGSRCSSGTWAARSGRGARRRRGRCPRGSTAPMRSPKPQPAGSSRRSSAIRHRTVCGCRSVSPVRPVASRWSCGRWRPMSIRRVPSPGPSPWSGPGVRRAEGVPGDRPVRLVLAG